jgi:hypothetical protein
MGFAPLNPSYGYGGCYSGCGGHRWSARVALKTPVA